MSANNESKIRYPFPRTAHVAGSNKTDDDEEWGQSSIRLEEGQVLVVQEKIDGANVGVFFDGDEMVMQGRTHELGHGEHPQYDVFQAFCWENYDDIKQVVGNTYVLYGELCIATHATEYDALPAWVSWFDAFDRSSQTFVSLRKLQEMTQDTELKLVPCRAVIEDAGGKTVALDEFEQALGESEYSASGEAAEGLVFRVDEGDTCVLRVKYVRSGFKAGNSKWQRDRIVQKNGLAD